LLDSEWLANAEAAAAASMDRAIIAEIPTRPGFRSLMRPWVDTWRVSTGDSAILARTLHDVGRFLAGIWALQLHWGPGGLTVSRLAEALQLSGMAGPGRARTTLIYLRFIGYIEPGSGGDGRTRRYQPTARMLTAFKTRLSRDLLAFWPVDPAILALGPHFDRDEVFGAYLTAVAEVTGLALRGYKKDGPSLEVASQRFGGFSVLGELLLSGPRDGPVPPPDPVPLSISALARDCHISRAQVRSVLIAAEEAGFLESLPDGRCRLTPLLSTHIDMLLAGSLIVIAFAARRALAVAQAQPALDPEAHFV